MTPGSSKYEDGRVALKTSAGVQNTEGGTPSLRNHSRFYRASKTKEGRVAKARGSSAQQPRGASAATLGCSAHFLQFSSLLLCFRDCGDILWCQIFAWRHWRHTTTPPTTHTHTHTERSLGWSRAPLCPGAGLPQRSVILARSRRSAGCCAPPANGALLIHSQMMTDLH